MRQNSGSSSHKLLKTYHKQGNVHIRSSARSYNHEIVVMAVFSCHF